MRYCVSQCLLGVPCRYDGRSKGIDLSVLGDAELVPFCPECAAGLGCPREPIELVQDAGTGGSLRVKAVHTRRDVTDALQRVGDAQVAALSALPGGVQGFVLKARSPSCGLRSPLHDASGREIGTAAGLWAQQVKDAFPGAWIGSEEELPALS